MLYNTEYITTENTYEGETGPIKGNFDAVEDENNLEDVSPRATRDFLLLETDVWVLSGGDLPPITAEQAAYRQALRDITDQDGFPTNITWPTKP